ncbi:hypothetical protein IGK47_003746 [Enterococcus sp. AZ007]
MLDKLKKIKKLLTIYNKHFFVLFLSYLLTGF